MKTNITIEIEEKLKIKALNEHKRFAFEAKVKGGIVDFVTTKINYKNHNIPYCIFYEIKTSFNDYFYSKNGANFIGDENYYVFTSELYDEILEKKALSKLVGKGVIIYKNGKLYKKVDGKDYSCKMNIEDKFKLQDEIIMKAIYNNYK